MNKLFLILINRKKNQLFTLLNFDNIYLNEIKYCEGLLYSLTLPTQKEEHSRQLCIIMYLEVWYGLLILVISLL